MMPRWWCEYAWLPPGRVGAGVLVSAKGARITAVQEDVVDAPADAERLRGLVLPGLANVHSHAFHRALRGRTERGHGDFWTWRQQMYRTAECLDPEIYLRLAKATYAEMALAGITCVGEFHYLHHQAGGGRYADANAMGHALVQAAAEAGVRITLLDTCYLTGGFDVPLDGVQLRFGDADAESWAGRVGDLRGSEQARIGAAIHSVRAVPREQLPVVVEWARENGATLHMHLSEQQAENDACQARYGCTPAELLAEAGALTARSTAVHATHVQAHDVDLLSDAGAGVCLCPTTERDLADGIGPAAIFAANAVPLSLGSDSHAVIDLFEEARAVELDERLATSRRGSFTASELLTAATSSGHRSLGWDDAGSLAVGQWADLVAVDLESPRTAGAGASAETVVFAASAVDVTDVVAGGRRVVRDHHHVDLPDVGAALRDAVEAVSDSA